MATMTVTAGALVRGQLRRGLQDMKWMGHGVEWEEDKGWLDSVFYIRGPRDIIKQLGDILDQYNRG